MTAVHESLALVLTSYRSTPARLAAPEPSVAVLSETGGGTGAFLSLGTTGTGSLTIKKALTFESGATCKFEWLMIAARSHGALSSP